MFGFRQRHPFPELTTMDALDEAIAASQSGPVLIYKHSLTCGTSAFALEQLKMLAKQEPELRIHYLPVQTAREVSDEIERRFRLRHESPQVILVDRGEVRWHASHWGVTAGKVRKALSTAARSTRSTES